MPDDRYTEPWGACDSAAGLQGDFPLYPIDTSVGIGAFGSAWADECTFGSRDLLVVADCSLREAGAFKVQVMADFEDLGLVFSH